MKSVLPFRGDDTLMYSITYDLTTPESRELGSFEESGYIVEPTEGELQDILLQANRDYGIYMPVGVGSFANPIAPEDNDYFTKGHEKYYTLFINKTDGSRLNQEELDFVTALLNEGKYSFDEDSNRFYEWGGTPEYGIGGWIGGTLIGGFLGYQVGKAVGYGRAVQGYAGGGGVGDKMTYDEMNDYEKSNHIHYNPMKSRWEVTKNGEHKEFWNQEEAEKFARFEYDDEKDSRYSRKRYEALFGYSQGGSMASGGEIKVKKDFGSGINFVSKGVRGSIVSKDASGIATIETSNGRTVYVHEDYLETIPTTYQGGGEITTGYIYKKYGVDIDEIMEHYNFYVEDEEENDNEPLSFDSWLENYGEDTAIMLSEIQGGSTYEGGGDIPEGFHQMPDGTIMPDSAHYGLGGLLLAGGFGAYVGYKIGRAKPKKTGFETEKKIARKIKSKLKYAGGGGVGDEWSYIRISGEYILKKGEKQVRLGYLKNTSFNDITSLVEELNSNPFENFAVSFYLTKTGASQDMSLFDSVFIGYETEIDEDDRLNVFGLERPIAEYIGKMKKYVKEYLIEKNDEYEGGGRISDLKKDLNEHKDVNVFFKLIPNDGSEEDGDENDLDINYVGETYTGGLDSDEPFVELGFQVSKANAGGGRISDLKKDLNEHKDVNVFFKLIPNDGSEEDGDENDLDINYVGETYTGGLDSDEPFVELGFQEPKSYAGGGEILVVKTKKGLKTMRDFEDFSKAEIKEWGTERGWKYNSEGEKYGGQALKMDEFFVKPMTKRSVKLPKSYQGGGGVEEVIKVYPKDNPRDTTSREYSWVNLGQSNNEVAQKTGTTGRVVSGNNLIALKSQTPTKTDYHILVEYLPAINEIGLVRGKQNSEPSPKYKKYIDDLYNHLNISKAYEGGGSVKKDKLQQARDYWKELEGQMSAKQKKFYNELLKRRQPSYERNFNDSEIAQYINGEIIEQFGVDLGITKYQISGVNWFKLGFKYIAYREAIEEPEFWEEMNEYEVGGETITKPRPTITPTETPVKPDKDNPYKPKVKPRPKADYLISNK
jgi:hypothetical protein